MLVQCCGSAPWNPSGRREIPTYLSGLTNREIAEHRYLGVATVKTHVSRLLTKPGARDRVQPVIAAYERGLVVGGLD
ncbi:response regulator transcription factor [Marinactinospora rubrisoli]|uniref:Response regulator transcription factor n=1 Tax=Marinactinospora rubrisoli TaxID=2715399 RepID=A0ABW2K9U5_9ACTN